MTDRSLDFIAYEYTPLADSVCLYDAYIHDEPPAREGLDASVLLGPTDMTAWFGALPEYAGPEALDPQSMLGPVDVARMFGALPEYAGPEGLDVQPIPPAAELALMFGDQYPELGPLMMLKLCLPGDP